jgi:hypothetical protein
MDPYNYYNISPFDTEHKIFLKYYLTNAHKCNLINMQFLIRLKNLKLIYVACSLDFNINIIINVVLALKTIKNWF